jgi:Protein of unknown function (DUF1203)
LTYDPFRDEVPGQPLPGPIFIHETSCAPYDGKGLPASIMGDRLTLTAYGENRAVVAEAQTVSSEEAAAALEGLRFDRTKYVHVRSTPNGCFLCQLDRLPA